MPTVLVEVVALAALVAMSFVANRRLAHVAKLPMQWGLNGKPTWWAPRRQALAFTPLVATAVLTAVALNKTAATGGAGMTRVLAAVFVVLHLVHLAAISRTLRAQ